MRRLLCVAALLPVLMWAWGRDGHRLITRLAVQHLPSDMPGFFTAAAGQLEMLSLAPDEWRDRDESHLAPTLLKDRDPDHYYSWEWYAPPSLPADVYAYADTVRGLGRELPRMGLLPYAAMEAYQRMRSDFRQWRRAVTDNKRYAEARYLEARIISDAGMLAHYIGDASQPLHVTENFNGWKAAANPHQYTTDTTLHKRFESDYVAAHIKDADVEPLLRPLQKGTLGLDTIYAHMQRANQEVGRLYDIEKVAPFGPENQNPDAHKLVIERLADGVSTLRDLWYCAYATSLPEPRPPATTPAVTTTPTAATAQP